MAKTTAGLAIKLQDSNTRAYQQELGECQLCAKESFLVYLETITEPWLPSN